jgi:hypothetical protein
MTNSFEQRWLLLILSLPTQSATARMRIWRSLKTLGCAALRDGAYLLPASPEHDRALQELSHECVREGGVAWTLAVLAVGEPGADAFPSLFNRAGDLAAQMSAWREVRSGLSKLKASELTRLHRKLRREYDAVRAIDFFPSEASVDAETLWRDFSAQVDRVLSPNEPQETEGQVRNLNVDEYQSRVWATRRRIWVDRVSSAWLIRRFIDPQARFLWLDEPEHCPRDAVGFDFDGATFTHVGDRVTFQTLLASFALEHDPPLGRIGALVHSLDVGGAPVPEALGFEAVLAGARERLSDDSALVDDMSRVLDSLYTHFARAGGSTQRTADAE